MKVKRKVVFPHHELFGSFWEQIESRSGTPAQTFFQDCVCVDLVGVLTDRGDGHHTHSDDQRQHYRVLHGRWSIFLLQKLDRLSQDSPNHDMTPVSVWEPATTVLKPTRAIGGVGHLKFPLWLVGPKKNRVSRWAAQHRAGVTHAANLDQLS
jgi:hypothetical protein